mgnify:CR=1 FL=1
MTELCLDKDKDINIKNFNLDMLSLSYNVEQYEEYSIENLNFLENNVINFRSMIVYIIKKTNEKILRVEIYHHMKKVKMS